MEMPLLCRRSFEVEKRQNSAPRLISLGHFSTHQLAERLHVSIPTVSRYVTALRARARNSCKTKGRRMVIRCCPQDRCAAIKQPEVP